MNDSASDENTIFLLLLWQVYRQWHGVHQRLFLVEVQNETKYQEEKSQHGALNPQRIPNTGRKQEAHKEGRGEPNIPEYLHGMQVW